MSRGNVLGMPQAATLADGEARELALDVRRSWIVEAPAGSGKTGLLIQRLLRLLGEETVLAPEAVLAITFTRAAAEEIRQRLLRELRQAEEATATAGEYSCVTRRLAERVLERSRSLGWQLLEDPRRLRVRTIDAVCAEIARSVPVLSGGGAALSPLEDAFPLYAEAARRTWLHLGSEDTLLSQALRTVLLHRDGDLDRCETLLATMLMEREQWSSLMPLREEDLTEQQQEQLEHRVRATLDQTLEQVVCSALSRLQRGFPPATLHRLTNLANVLSHRSGYLGQISPLAICRELHTAPGAAADHLAHWRALAHLLIAPSHGSWRRRFNRRDLRFDTETNDHALLKEVQQEVQGQPALLELLNSLSLLPPIRFPDDQWVVTKALFRILRQGLAELQSVFKTRGACDFAESALLARYVFESDDGVQSFRMSAGSELQHLLVDEMQDTSTRQYELLERLTSGWTGSGKTVFLVGDPKQSIYLFRQARVERFLAMTRSGLLGDLPVTNLRLTANFRSQPALVDAFNEDFSAIFPPGSSAPEEVTFTRAAAARVASRSDSMEASGRWHLEQNTADRDQIGDATQPQAVRNAREIRTILESWRARPLPRGRSTPWTIAVLVRSRASLANVLIELQRDPFVPVRALKIDTLTERREVLDLLALTRALLHEADRTAWLAVLRAPWCGLDLADLHVLTGQDDVAALNKTVMDLISIYGAELSGDGLARLERIWPALQAAVHLSGRLRLPEVVERTWRSLGGDAYLDGAERENATAYLDLLRSLDHEAGEITLPELQRRLRKLYAAPGSEEGAVDLLTIHGAKGLEWDVVVVPELERGTPVSAPRLLDWEELPQGGVVLAPISGKGEESRALTQWLRSLRAGREAAEAKRLLYVAATRAREELHLFGMPSVAADGTVKAKVGSLLHAGWAAAEAQLSGTERRAASPQSTGLSLAAQADVAEVADRTGRQEQPAMLDRLPLSFRPFSHLPPQTLSERSFAATPKTVDRFLRPEGSFAARALGNSVHVFLEELAARLAAGSDTRALLRELPAWESRVRAVLRSGGLPQKVIAQHTRTTLTAMRRTLESETGSWLLGSRTDARSELALTVGQADFQHYRIDRIFRAGAEPLAVGEQHLWIIDYKTGTTPATDQNEVAAEASLLRERERYQRQLERYARVLGQRDVRLALWFPLVGRLTWWIAEDQAHESATDRIAARADLQV